MVLLKFYIKLLLLHGLSKCINLVQHIMLWIDFR